MSCCNQNACHFLAVKSKPAKQTFAAFLKSSRGTLTARQAAQAVTPLLSFRTWQEWESGRQTPPPWVQQLLRESIAAKSPPFVPSRK